MIRTPGAPTTAFYLAPGGVNSGAMRLPGRDADEGADIRKAPRLGPSDHLVEPGTRQEMFRGQIVEVLPARPGHGDLHSRLDKIVELHAVDGHVASSDLLTRRSLDGAADNAAIPLVKVQPCQLPESDM
jgi:hypothetical protein